MTLDVSSPWWTAIVVAHAASTWFLVGLIWMIQRVHYPSFASIHPDRYETFQQRHMEAMGRLIGLPWLIEGLSVLAVFLWAPTTEMRVIAAVGGLLEAVVIAVTIWSSIPAHAALSAGFSAAAHERLLQSNWARTAAWTLRGLLAVALLVVTLRAA